MVEKKNLLFWLKDDLSKAAGQAGQAILDNHLQQPAKQDMLKPARRSMLANDLQVKQDLLAIDLLKPGIQGTSVHDLPETSKQDMLTSRDLQRLARQDMMNLFFTW